MLFFRLDILILKSDIQLSKRYMTEEGLELHMAVNHLGPFLLSNLLLPILHKTIMIKRFESQSTNSIYKSMNGDGITILRGFIQIMLLSLVTLHNITFIFVKKIRSKTP